MESLNLDKGRKKDIKTQGNCARGCKNALKISASLSYVYSISTFSGAERCSLTTFGCDCREQLPPSSFLEIFLLRFFFFF